MNMPEGYATKLARKPVMSPDPKVYVSAETYEAERRNVFARTWQYVGDARSLGKAGDRVAATFAG